MGIRHLIAFFLVITMSAGTLAKMSGKKTKYFEFDVHPSRPTYDQDITIYVAATSGYSSSSELELIAQFNFDNAPIEGEELSSKLWSVKIPGPHEGGLYLFEAKLFIQDKVRAQALKERLREIQQEILNLEADLVSSDDLEERNTLLLSINEKKALKSQAELELFELPQFIGKEDISFKIESQWPVKHLLKIMVNGEGHHVNIQNNDHGWDDFVTNQEDLWDRSNQSYSTQFGQHGQGLLDTHKVTGHKYFLANITNTATVINSRPVGVKVSARAARCTFLNGYDSSYLINLGTYLSNSNFLSKGLTAAAHFKTCMKAMHVVDTVVLENTSIDLVSETDIENVSDNEAAQRFRSFLISLNRPVGRRAYEILLRFDEALAAHDSDFALALAQVAAAEVLSISPATYNYLIGVASTLEMIAHFRDVDPMFSPLIQTLLGQLLPYQKSDGLFEYYLNANTFGGGGPQDNAYIIRALLKIGGHKSVINNIINGFYTHQQPAGGYYMNNIENIQGQAELLTALAKVAIANDIVLYNKKN